MCLEDTEQIYHLKKDKKIGIQRPVNAHQEGTSPCRGDIKFQVKFPRTEGWQILHILDSQAWGTQTRVRKLDSTYMVFPSSLIEEKWKQGLWKVNQENWAILDRITKSQPQYQVQWWHEDWQQAEKHTANISRYPHEQHKSQSQKVALSFCSFLHSYFWIRTAQRAHFAALLCWGLTARGSQPHN